MVTTFTISQSIYSHFKFFYITVEEVAFGYATLVRMWK